MSNYQDRMKIIDELQKKRESVLITFFALTDRPNAPNFMVADDAISPLHSLLERIGHRETIDMFLYTRGGAMMSAYSIVKMFREYTSKFNVIVPFRCMSAGTQIALGADSIVMGKIGQLSPVDPSTTNIFNPLVNEKGDPTDPFNRKPISVEDVQSYLNLAKDKVGLVSENDSLEVFKELTKHYEPLALGNVNRVYTETRLMAREMLSLHMDPKTEGERIDQIIKALTETYTHDFIVTRDIAEKIGLKVVRPTTEQESLITKLFWSYQDELKMNVPFDLEALPLTPIAQNPQPQPVADQQQQPQIPQISPRQIRFKLAAIEDANSSFMWVNEGAVYPSLSEIMPQLLAQPGAYPPTPVLKFKSGAWREYASLSGNFE